MDGVIGGSRDRGHADRRGQHKDAEEKGVTGTALALS